MSRALIVYGTKTGCTEGVAQSIAEGLRSAGAEVSVVRAEDKPDAAPYDAVVIGSGIRAGQWHGAAKQWLTANAEALKQRPIALFTACLTMASNPEKVDEVRAYTDVLLTETGLAPVEVGAFPGMNMPKAFSLPERLIMKAMKAPEGDFRDPAAAEAWGREVAGKLGLV
jgi:menaquinone-dependent protoporphyrinogen oxidase